MLPFLHQALFSRRLSLTACIVQLFLCSFAQTHTIDSLQKVLPHLSGTAKIDCLNALGSELSDRYWSRSKYQQTDTAFMYTQLAQDESQQLHYTQGIGKALLNRSIIEEEHGNFKAAEDYIRKALTILEKGKKQAEYHRASVFLGWILYNRGSFTESIDIHKNELPYYEAIKDAEHIAAISRMIARAYDFAGKSSDAFTYFQKDFAIQKEPIDTWGKRSSATLKAAVYLSAGDTATAAFYYQQAALFSTNQHTIIEAYHSNRAIAYSLLKKYDSALVEMQKSIAIIHSSQNDSLFRNVALMTSCNTMANVFLSLKLYDSAIAYSMPSLRFFEKGDYVTALLPTLKTLAAAYSAKQQKTKALYYTNRLMAYANRSGARRYQRDGYKLLWNIYKSQHQYNLAGKYQLKYMLLNDSLENDKYISQAAAWKAINDINTNKARYQSRLALNIATNNAKILFINTQKRTQQYVFMAAIAMISLFTVLMRRNNRLRRNKDRLQLIVTEANLVNERHIREQEINQLHQQKTELELQALRAQMNPHFIFNCLNSINRFIITNDAKKAADYLTKFAKLIRIVLEQSGKAFVPLEDEIACLQLYMDLESLRFENPFQYHIDLNGTDVSSVHIPTMMIQPFVENAIWHGLQGNSHHQGDIRIRMHLEHGLLHCEISDNGIGRANAAQKENEMPGKKSLGMHITQHRLQLIDTTGQHESAIDIHDVTNENGRCSGTCVSIRIPVKEL